jgi:hypothetical protein
MVVPSWSDTSYASAPVAPPLDGSYTVTIMFLQVRQESLCGLLPTARMQISRLLVVRNGRTKSLAMSTQNQALRRQ